MDETDIARALGDVEGQLKGINNKLCCHGKMLGKITKRVNRVESQSAKYGGGSGSLVALIITVGSEYIKTKLGI